MAAAVAEATGAAKVARGANGGAQRERERLYDLAETVILGRIRPSPPAQLLSGLLQGGGSTGRRRGKESSGGRDRRGPEVAPMQIQILTGVHIAPSLLSAYRSLVRLRVQCNGRWNGLAGNDFVGSNDNEDKLLARAIQWKIERVWYVVQQSNGMYNKFLALVLQIAPLSPSLCE